MAIKGISYAEKHWYVCRDDPGLHDTLEESREAGATIFHWGAIPNIVMAAISDKQTSSSVTMGDMLTQTYHQRTAQRNRDAFRFGIRNFENFPDENGDLIDCEFTSVLEGGQSYQVVSEDTLNQVPLKVIQEVGAHIFNTNSLGDEGRKKLEEQLSHSDGSKDGNVKSAARKKGGKGGAKRVRSSTVAKPDHKSLTSTGPTP